MVPARPVRGSMAKPCRRRWTQQEAGTPAGSSKRRVIVVGCGAGRPRVRAQPGAPHDIPVTGARSHSELFMDLRAGSFHPPSLEVLEPIGVTERLLGMGIVVPAWQLRDRSEGVIGVFELASLLKDETRYPFRLHCEQHELTPLVYEMLRPIPHVSVGFSARANAVQHTGDG